MISGEIYRVIYFLAKKPTFDQCAKRLALGCYQPSAEVIIV